MHTRRGIQRPIPGVPGPLLLWMTAAPLIAACESRAADTGLVVRDSAAVTVSESRGAAWETTAGWSIATEPMLSIGVADGAADQQLFGVLSAVRLGDGRIVVANRGTAEVRWYGPDGTLLASRGGAGGGPDEFRDLASVHRLAADSVGAYDFATGRVRIYDPNAVLVRSVQLARPTSAPLRGLSFLAGGRMAAVPPGASSRADTSRTGQVIRDSVPVLMFAPDGALEDTLRIVPGAEQFVSGRLGRAFVTIAPFGRETVLAAYEDTLWVGTGQDFELAGYGPDGGLARLVRVLGADSAVTAEHMTDFRRELLDLLPVEAAEQRARMREALEEMPTPLTHPAYARLLTDPDGNFWLGGWSLPVAEPTRWRVVAADGRYLGGITVPPRTRLLEVGRDWLLVRRQDELDVERVQLLPLRKP
ncbi:MAG: hypothetical protein WEB88_16895 [Gemmatimonadota bacterium]